MLGQVTQYVRSVVDGFATKLQQASGSVEVDSSGAVQAVPADGQSVRARSEEDAATVAPLIAEGDRATPADGDTVQIPVYLSDASGNQDEFARIEVVADDVTDTSEDATIRLWVRVAGTMTKVFEVSSGGQAVLPESSLGWAGGTAIASPDDLWNLTEFDRETLAGAKTLTTSDPRLQTLDPDGANRDVNLPAEATPLMYVIQNRADAASEDLIVKDDAGTIVVTVGQDRTALVMSDGTGWTALLGAAV